MAQKRHDWEKKMRKDGGGVLKPGGFLKFDSLGDFIEYVEETQKNWTREEWDRFFNTFERISKAVKDGGDVGVAALWSYGMESIK